MTGRPRPAPAAPARPALYALPDPDAPPPAPRLDALDPEQREAVLCTDGPLLVIAGAGSGKTRIITERTAHLIEQGIAHPGQILSITFTNKAAGEMRERLARRVGPELAGAVTLGTFHALCARILRAHPGDSGRSARYSIYDEGDQKRVLERYLTRADKARIERDEALAAISRAKNHLVPRDRFASATPDELGGLVLHDDIKQIIASVWGQVDAELERSDALDFDDLIGFTVALLERQPDVLAGYRRRWRYVQVDEHQDTNPLQDRLLRLLAGENPNLMVVGDDQQCLIAGTPITMADRTCRLIEHVRAGDRVLSSHGRGRFGAARVTRVHRSHGTDGVAIVTACGRRVVSTPEHVHFAGYRPGTTLPLFLTYLMRRAGVGFRVGTTRTIVGEKAQFSGLGLRTVYERGDAAWVVSTHGAELEARLAEASLSLRYALPTVPFIARRKSTDRAGSVVGNQKALDRLFASIDSEAGARRLLHDHGLSLSHPHHLPQNDPGRGRHIAVGLCQSPTGSHVLEATDADAGIRGRLEAAGYRPRPAKAGGWRLRLQSADMGSLLQHAERLRALMSMDIRMVAYLGCPHVGGRKTSLPLLPARAVRPGMAMITQQGYDVVVSVERVRLEQPVYDLDVARTHNYVANGIVTHNSIYRFRSADVRNILRFDRDYPHARVVGLVRNYRSTPQVVAAANRLIAHNTTRRPKTMVAQAPAGPEPVCRAHASEEAEARWAAAAIARAGAHGIARSEIAVLARAKGVLTSIESALVAAEIPYQVLSGTAFYQRREVKAALAHLALLVNPHDAEAFSRVMLDARPGIGEVTAARVDAHATTANISLLEACVQADGLSRTRRDQKVSLITFGRAMLELAGQLERRSVSSLLAEVVRLPHGLQEALARHDDGETRSARLHDLVAAARAYERDAGDPSPVDFLARAALAAGGDQAAGEPDPDRVTLCTVHGAKGLEWQVVLVCRLEEGTFPSQHAALPEAMEEERRLAYVAVTRAKRTLVLSHSHRRYGRAARPSRFIAEALCAPGAPPPPNPAAGPQPRARTRA